MIQHANNPFTWGSNSSSFIFSGVLDITLKQNSKKMEISNLTKPIGLSLPCDTGQKGTTPQPKTHFFIKPSNGSNNFRYHPFKIPSEVHNVEFKIIPEEGRTLEIFIQARRKPTDIQFNYTKTIPDFSSCDTSNDDKNCSSKYTFTITSETTGMTGLHYLGLRFLKNTTTEDLDPIKVRKRRDCTSSNGRQKRSCVGVKDPPTTPPPTPITVVPIYDPLTDANYTLSSTVTFCGYWNEEKERWTSEGCKVNTLYLLLKFIVDVLYLKT